MTVIIFQKNDDFLCFVVNNKAGEIFSPKKKNDDFLDNQP